MKNSFFLVLSIIFIFSCSKEKDEPLDKNNIESIYFPPIGNNSWETTSPTDLNWDTTAISELYTFLNQNDTRAFIILKNGKIVIEKYWGNNILNNGTFDQNSQWYWASAGKTLTAFLVGIAQEKTLLNINDKTSEYLGKNWTSMPIDKEDKILIKNQLTMTTGLDYTNGNFDCTDSNCLSYKADAGTQWFYHNAPYTLLENVISNSSNQSYNDFTKKEISDKIGMVGNWIKLGFNNVFRSTARSAARFGLLLLNNGKWDQKAVLSDQNYLNAMKSSSQSINLSYGYLTWLNGKKSIVLPGSEFTFNLSLASNAPSDLYAAMGKNGQFINCIPSLNMVVIRMGELQDSSANPVLFHDEMWGKINKVIK